jgi:hypothetical protein
VAKILGLNGAQGSGKDTLAQNLIALFSQVGVKVASYSLADPIKELIHRRCKVPREYLWGTQEQKDSVPPGYTMTGRTMCKLVGSEALSKIYPAVWADLMELEVEANYERAALYVCTDVRLPVETKVCAEVWFLEGGSNHDNHFTETALREYPFAVTLPRMPDPKQRALLAMHKIIERGLLS